jgi:3-keto-L-gulonate-6-phosphate decarboxylase
MKLQIAMDMTSEDLFWDVIDKVHDLVEIVEIGNLGMYTGAQLIPTLKEKYPDNEIVWDQKVQFLYTNTPAIDLGADYVSVDADAPDSYFKAHLEYGHKHNCKIIGDMITSTAGSAQMIRLESLGVDQISFHPNAHHDRYPVGDVLQMKVARVVVEHTEICAYGGFTVDNMVPVLELKPEIVCVGAAIWNAKDPRKATQDIRDLMKKYE